MIDDDLVRVSKQTQEGGCDCFPRVKLKLKIDLICQLVRGWDLNGVMFVAKEASSFGQCMFGLKMGSPGQSVGP